MPAFNPDSWMDFILLVVLGLIGAAGLIVPAIVAHRRQGRDICEIKEEVKNDHNTNLRDDLDALKDLMLDGFLTLRSEFSRELSCLREDMHTERIERIEGDKLKIVRGVAK